MMPAADTSTLGCASPCTNLFVSTASVAVGMKKLIGLRVAEAPVYRAA